MTTDWLDNSSDHTPDDLGALDDLKSEIVSIVNNHWQDEPNVGIYLPQLGVELGHNMPDYKNTLRAMRLVDLISEQIEELRIVRNPKRLGQIKVVPIAKSEGLRDETFFSGITSHESADIPSFRSELWDMFKRPLRDNERRSVVIRKDAAPFFVNGHYPPKRGEKVYEVTSEDTHTGEIVPASEFPILVYNRIKNWLDDKDLDEELFVSPDRTSIRIDAGSKLDRLYRILGDDAEFVNLPVDIAFRLSRDLSGS